MTIAEENYLKAILQLETEGKETVSTNQLAAAMQTKPSSVTDMLKRLKIRRLVNYEKYQGVKLTSTGRNAAMEMLRKHRLWETFLLEKLHFSWKDVHQVAEQLEHVKSEYLIDRLDSYLQYPDYDPHGEPIPDKDGVMAPLSGKLMSGVEADKSYMLVAVMKPTVELLSFLDKIGLQLGCSFKVINVEEYNGAIEIEIDGKACFLTCDVANQLLIKGNEED